MFEIETMQIQMIDIAFSIISIVLIFGAISENYKMRKLLEYAKKQLHLAKVSAEPKHVIHINGDAANRYSASFLVHAETSVLNADTLPELLRKIADEIEEAYED